VELKDEYVLYKPSSGGGQEMTDSQEIEHTKGAQVSAVRFLENGQHVLVTIQPGEFPDLDRNFETERFLRENMLHEVRVFFDSL
jgi:hypothetical protein